MKDVTAKVVIYEAFIEGRLEAPRHLARSVHDRSSQRGNLSIHSIAYATWTSCSPLLLDRMGCISRFLAHRPASPHNTDVFCFLANTGWNKSLHEPDGASAEPHREAHISNAVAFYRQAANKCAFGCDPETPQASPSD